MRSFLQLAVLFISTCTTSGPKGPSPDVSLGPSRHGDTRWSLPVYVDTGLVEVGPAQITVLTTIVPPDSQEIAPPLILNQHVCLSQNDSQTVAFDFSIDRTVFLYHSTFRVSVLSVYLNEIGIIPGKNQYMFVLHGYGGCDGCKMYIEIMNEAGNMLYSQLSDKSKVYSESGDFRKVVDQAGFSLKDYLAGHYPKLSIPAAYEP